MHEGTVSKELGIKGMPAEGETAMNERDIELVRQTGGRLHILHLSVKRAVNLVRQAKQDGLPVTAEASPHHIALTDEDVRIYGTAGKMSPPLRAKEDQDAVIAGLQDGTIDALATDHAPHTNEEKLRAFTESPNGILGFETAVGILLTKLVHTHTLSLKDTIAKLTIEPARILGIEGGTLSVGKAADITVIDLNQEWVVDANQFKSKSRNTPFHGWTLKGRATTTILNGRITHQV